MLRELRAEARKLSPAESKRFHRRTATLLSPDRSGGPEARLVTASAFRAKAALSAAVARTAASRKQDTAHGLFLGLARRFENVHPDDQSTLEAIAVANAGVGDELSGARVVHDLMDIDRDAAVAPPA